MLILIYCILLKKVINLIFLNSTLANLELNNYYTYDDFFTPVISFIKFLLSIDLDEHLERAGLHKKLILPSFVI